MTDKEVSTEKRTPHVALWMTQDAAHYKRAQRIARMYEQNGASVVLISGWYDREGLADLMKADPMGAFGVKSDKGHLPIVFNAGKVAGFPHFKAWDKTASLLRSMLQTLQIDLLHCFGLEALQSIVAGMPESTARRLKYHVQYERAGFEFTKPPFPVVYDIEELEAHRWEDGWNERWADNNRWLERACLPLVDHVIAATEPLADAFAWEHKTETPKTIEAWPQNTGEQWDARDLDGVRETDPIVVYRGDITERHMVHQAIEAVTMLGKPWHLVCIGRNMLDKRTLGWAMQTGQVTILDRDQESIDPHAMATVLFAGQDLTYPSDRLKLPECAMLAIRSGLPMVCSNLKAVRDAAPKASLYDNTTPDLCAGLARMVDPDRSLIMAPAPTVASLRVGHILDEVRT